MAATLLLALALIAAFAAGFLLARRRTRPEARAARVASTPAAATITTVAFDPGEARGTRATELEAHAPAWREAMRGVGVRLEAANVRAVVFVHGTFTGTDPLSAYRLVERGLPAVGRDVARALRRTTRSALDRLLGDLGNFGPAYARLFEGAAGGRIPCTTFVWSSENHHVGRLEAALGLVRVLATHAELAALPSRGDRPGRVLVVGHSHAGQVFALVTQLLAQSVATEAVLDVARVRGLDVGALETDLETLDGIGLDLVTFGAPARYAWAQVPGVRALHVLAAPARGSLGGDWIQRIGVEGSDLPALDPEDRRVNAALERSLGPGFAPARLATAVWEPPPRLHGDLVLVDYGADGLRSAIRSGLGHGAYTRLDAMLFHARLVAERLYPEEPGAPPASAWSRLRALVA